MKTRWRELDDDDWWDTPEGELHGERIQQVATDVTKYFGTFDHDDLGMTMAGLYREHPIVWTTLSTKELAGVIYMRLVFSDAD